MQNLKNQPSASDSATTEATNGNGRANGTPASDDAAITVDPVEEPDFLDYVEAPPTEEPAKQKPSVGEVPVPEDSTVEEPAIRPRSLRMQWRFWRTLVFAGWLFARVLFWQVYAKRYVPGYVKESETRRFQKYAREFRDFAVKLGGLYIKLGQFISTRVDVLPEEIIKELESLQDEVPTIQFKYISHVIEREIGPIPDHFEWINEDPIAAASLGQVHRAKLHNGDRVVVKVQRPGIRTICFTDLAAMRVVAKIAMRFKFISRRADASALVEEFGTVLLEELSYNHEAFNAHRFTQIFKHNMGVYIPSVYNNLSTDELLVIEDVTSIKINDYAAMDRAGVNRKAVANRLMDTYLSQVFDEYFFHADPHPGNLFVYPLPVEDENADFGEEGRPFYLIFVDFGMTGTLTREIADGMVSTLSSVLTRDTKKLIESYIELGFILPNADVPRIVEAADAAFDTVWGMSMTEMRDMDFDRVAHLADEFNDLIFSMPFYIPQDFIYLGRTLSILSGMCTSLDPKYNPWKELQPYTELLIARGFGIDANTQQRLPGNLTTSIVQSLFNGNGRAVLQQVAQEASRRALGPVARADDALQKLSSGDIQVVTKMDLAYRHQMKRIERETQRNGRSIFFGSVLITATLFYINGDMTLAIIGYVICALVMVLGLLRD